MKYLRVYQDIPIFKFVIKNNVSLTVFFISIVISSVWSILLGQDANWDLKNYHYYNAYAFFENRIALDIAPAQFQTYFNPALDLLPYLLIQHFPPLVFGWVLGAWHGLNLWIVFLIGRKIFIRQNNPNPVFWALIATIAAATTPIFVGEIGTTLHDLTVSVFILGSIYLYIVSWDESEKSSKKSIRYLMFSGFLLGFCVGLKLTMAIYAVGMGVAILVVQMGMLRRYQGLIQFILSALVGFFVAGGWWMIILWKQFGNPLFPMFNKLFQSPYALIENISDKRFLPDTFLHALSFPFKFTSSVHAGSELAFQDYRIAIFYVISIVWLGFLLSSLVSSNYRYTLDEKPMGIDLNFLWLQIFVWISYLVWILLFAIYRYLVCIELLLPVALIAIVGKSAALRSVKIFILTILMFVVISSHSPDYGRLPWADRFFGVDVPVIDRPEKSIVLISSSNPLAYVVPWFPDSVRIIRIQGNFPRPDQVTGLTDKIAAILSHENNDLYLLTNGSEVNDGLQVVNKYLVRNYAEVEYCEPITSRLDRSIVLCRLSSKGIH